MNRDTQENSAADYANLSFEYRAARKYHLAHAAGLRARRMGWIDKVADVSFAELSQYPLDPADAEVFAQLNEGSRPSIFKRVFMWILMIPIVLAIMASCALQASCHSNMTSGRPMFELVTYDAPPPKKTPVASPPPEPPELLKKPR